MAPDISSNKAIVGDLLARLPAEVSLHQIAREIEFVAAVREGLADLDAGNAISLDQVEGELPTWLIR